MRLGLKIRRRLGRLNRLVSFAVILIGFSGVRVQAESFPEQIQGRDGMPMRLIPAGWFNMGRPEGGPAHSISLDGFFLDVFEVTNEMYRAFVRVEGRKPSPFDGDLRFHHRKHPAVGMTWFEAKAYCEWAGKRLPTEAEWEKAARGSDGRIRPWGNAGFKAGNSYRANFNAVLIHPSTFYSTKYDLDGFWFTSPVGSFRLGVSPYGIHDLIGNVAEWVADWFDESYYQEIPWLNPQGPPDGRGKVRRGGSWIHVMHLNSYSRDWGNPSVGSFTTGFRCAITPKYRTGVLLRVLPQSPDRTERTSVVRRKRLYQ